MSSHRPPQVDLLRRVLDEGCTTSWGPARVLNYVVGERLVHAEAPQGSRQTLASGNVRAINVLAIVLLHSALCQALMRPLRAAGLQTHACVLTFVLCEIRKYFKPTAHVLCMTEGDARDLEAFVTALTQAGPAGRRLKRHACVVADDDLPSNYFGEA